MNIEVKANEIIKKATELHASDIYILPNDDMYSVKFQSGENIGEAMLLGWEIAERLINFFKYSAGMAVSEKRRPQTGHIEWQLKDNVYFLRFSVVGDFKGNESLVIRIIYDATAGELGFFDETVISQIVDLSKQRGLVVFSGPTGSGKTSTIYEVARLFAIKDIVMTIEDPVEVRQNSFIQLQVNREAGMTYPNLIKLGLRHRPGVFIIGEIRDEETAAAAIQAALTGHLVLTTIHAQNPFGVIQRLRQLDASEIFIDQALNAVVYQRLVPTIDDSLKANVVIETAKSISLATKKYDWHKWQQGLFLALEEGEIDEYQYEKFKTG
ncbi:competence type IV pilus ATPase ComGA [Lentilactobacillus sp. Marseille-Q4993]|uniref:competence type IV pilus ATPase ComGA n=1 Tax=Lentilactobacillus sp. Marseille-Q4993 TaxID=3039492 RepID=UPI0024BD1E13|nr:competence type IV pilus ATPase ComGA [Lentilactobacillus sp. Marseille-Q4993]